MVQAAVSAGLCSIMFSEACDGVAKAGSLPYKLLEVMPPV